MQKDSPNVTVRPICFCTPRVMGITNGAVCNVGHYTPIQPHWRCSYKNHLVETLPLPKKKSKKKKKEGSITHVLLLLIGSCARMAITNPDDWKLKVQENRSKTKSPSPMEDSKPYKTPKQNCPKFSQSIRPLPAYL